jgi:hypothetical protein
MHRARPLGLSRTLAERHAHFGDEHGKAGVRDEGLWPQPRVQFCLGQRAGAIAKQQDEQIERFRGQVHGGAMAPQLPRVVIHDDVTETKSDVA